MNSRNGLHWKKGSMHQSDWSDLVPWRLFLDRFPWTAWEIDSDCGMEWEQNWKHFKWNVRKCGEFWPGGSLQCFQFRRPLCIWKIILNWYKDVNRHCVWTMVVGGRDIFAALIIFWYILQGIEWTHIEYFNNAIICELIENVSGPFPVWFENRLTF